MRHDEMARYYMAEMSERLVLAEDEAGTAEPLTVRTFWMLAGATLVLPIGALVVGWIL